MELIYRGNLRYVLDHDIVLVSRRGLILLESMHDYLATKEYLRKDILHCSKIIDGEPGTFKYEVEKGDEPIEYNLLLFVSAGTAGGEISDYVCEGFIELSHSVTSKPTRNEQISLEYNIIENTIEELHITRDYESLTIDENSYVDDSLGGSDYRSWSKEKVKKELDLTLTTCSIYENGRSKDSLTPAFGGVIHKGILYRESRNINLDINSRTEKPADFRLHEYKGDYWLVAEYRGSSYSDYLFHNLSKVPTLDTPVWEEATSANTFRVSNLEGKIVTPSLVIYKRGNKLFRVDPRESILSSNSDLLSGLDAGYDMSGEGRNVIYSDLTSRSNWCLSKDVLVSLSNKSFEVKPDEEYTLVSTDGVVFVIKVQESKVPGAFRYNLYYDGALDGGFNLSGITDEKDIKVIGGGRVLVKRGNGVQYINSLESTNVVLTNLGELINAFPSWNKFIPSMPYNSPIKFNRLAILNEVIVYGVEVQSKIILV